MYKKLLEKFIRKKKKKISTLDRYNGSDLMSPITVHTNNV